MESTPESLLKEAAFVFQRSGRNLSSALVYAEVARHIEKDPAIYTGMGAALAKSADGDDKLLFYTWATKALKRGLLLGQGTMFESPCVNWLEIIKEEMDVVQPDPMEMSDLDGLAAFLNDKGVNLVTDLGRISESDLTATVMAMIGLPREQFMPVALAALAGEFGEMIQRMALLNIQRFGDTPQIREALAKVALEFDSYALQPELGETMKAIDPEWAAQFKTE